MKKVRSLVSKWYIVLPMALIMFMESCSKELVNSKDYSGQDLFNGVFFAKGDAGKRISEFTSNYDLYTSSPEEAEALNKVQNDVVEYINTVHPEFFKSFKEDIQSGNVAVVKSSMISAAKLIAEALKIDYTTVSKSFTKEQLADLRSQLKNSNSATAKEKLGILNRTKYKTILKSMYAKDPSGGTSEYEGSSVSVNLAIYFSVAAVVAAVFVLVVVLGETETPQSVSPDALASTDNLYREQMFSTIAENLSANH